MKLTEESKPIKEIEGSSQYKIVIEGELNESWSKWLGDVNLENFNQQHGSSQTTIYGSIPDQAALRGLLNKIWDLNLTLISVNIQEFESKGKNYEY